MGQTASANASPPATMPAACPVQHQQSKAQCPVAHDGIKSSASRSQCPIAHDKATLPPSHPPISESTHPSETPAASSSTSLWSSKLNPLNYMPFLSQEPAPSQQSILATDRTLSSIPRPSSSASASPHSDPNAPSPADHQGGSPAESSVWEYPSPQQFYNALVRKGMEAPEEDIDIMVHIHNFLNEEAWEEVLRWERQRDSNAEVELARFRGRPGQLSPKARFYMLAGWLLPSRFNSEPPFDRHDWIIRRPGTNEEVRYVIDYYSAPPLPDGSPVFSLDVRPALDSVSSVQDRIRAATRDAWEGLRGSFAANGGSDNAMGSKS